MNVESMWGEESKSWGCREGGWKCCVCRRPDRKETGQRRLGGGHKLLHMGNDGRRNGVGIIVSEEINKQVVRVER